MTTTEPCLEKTIYLRAPKFNPLIGLFGFFYLVALMTTIASYFKWKRLVWEGLYMPAIPLVYFYFFFASWRIEITPREITIVTFFWSRKTIQRSDIINWSARTGWKPGEKVNKPYRRVEIYTAKDNQPFVINTKPIRYEDYQTLLSLLPVDMKIE